MGMFEELRRRPPDGLKAQQSRRVDYACGGWFLETAWLHAFFREPRGTTVTGEDMHLSYTAHKYLGVETFAFWELKRPPPRRPCLRCDPILSMT
mmetsp:Transcript_114582/g.262958  ORF Transcript_114582/g.262958 Transcript_114582/m.262958 type:complete len:94 (+) Transcript_114582:540-821(+)